MARYKYSENTKEVTDIYFDTETHGEFMGMEQGGEMKKVTTARLKEKLLGEITLGVDWQQEVLTITSTPPVSPTEGDRYIVGTSATGSWEGRDDYIAEYNSGAWLFLAPQTRMGVFLYNDMYFLIYLDEEWQLLATLDEITELRDEVQGYRDEILNDPNFQAVSADLRGDDTIGAVATALAIITAVANNETNITAVADNETNINAVNANKTNINAVNANKPNIDKVADNEANITAVADNEANINAVNANKANINAVNANKTNIDKVANIDQEVTDVAGIKTEVENVSAIRNNITAVDGNKTNINAVHANKNNIDKVANINNDVTKVANIDTDVSAVALIDDDVTDVALIKQDVTDVAGIKTNVTNVAGIKDNVVAVDGNKANINAVHANKTNIDAVAGNKTNIDAVKNNSANINTVAGNLSGANTIGTVAGSISNVNNVGGNIGNVNAVASNKSNIDAVAGNKSNIDTVAGMKDNINALAPHSQAVADLGARTAELDLVAEALGDIDDLEKVNNKVTEWNSPTDTEYPSAKLVHTGLLAFEKDINILLRRSGLLGYVSPGGWDEIADITQQGDMHLYHDEGDEFQTALKFGNDWVPAIVRIIGLNKDKLVRDSSAPSTTFEFKDILWRQSFDSREPNNSDSNRKSYGNNNWGWSNLRQYLNSENLTFVYGAKHPADAPPDNYNADSLAVYEGPGFLARLDPELASVIAPVKKWTALNTVVDGGGAVETEERVFLLSRKEVGLGDEGTVTNEFVYNFYNGAVNADRIKLEASGSAYPWWLRSPYVSYSHHVRHVNPDGSLHSRVARHSYGVAPAFVIG